MDVYLLFLELAPESSDVYVIPVGEISSRLIKALEIVDGKALDGEYVDEATTEAVMLVSYALCNASGLYSGLYSDNNREYSGCLRRFKVKENDKDYAAKLSNLSVARVFKVSTFV